MILIRNSRGLRSRTHTSLVRQKASLKALCKRNAECTAENGLRLECLRKNGNKESGELGDICDHQQHSNRNINKSHGRDRCIGKADSLFDTAKCNNGDHNNNDNRNHIVDRFRNIRGTVKRCVHNRAH